MRIGSVEVEGLFCGWGSGLVGGCERGEYSNYLLQESELTVFAMRDDLILSYC